MYCRYCGQDIGTGEKPFCPNCGKETGTAPKNKTVQTAPRPKYTALIVIGAAVVVLLAVLLICVLGKGGEKQNEVPDTEAPEVAIVGDWLTREGIGFTFTEDGFLRLRGGDFSFLGDKLTYEVVDEDTLYLCPDEDILFGVGVDVPYRLDGNTLYIEIEDFSLVFYKQ